jgi:altronate dehydratase small subunit
MLNSAIVVDKLDNVATALRNLEPGESIRIDIGGTVNEIAIKESIPQGFKIALEDISEGQPVIKYGEVIGLATQNIAKGICVHIHNLEGMKGRGDKA